MLTVTSFADCVRANLKEKRYGKERADAVVNEFEGRMKFHLNDGKASVDAAALAMKETFDNISMLAIEKSKRTAKMLSLQAENIDRVNKAVALGKYDKVDSIVRSGIAQIERDRVLGGLNYTDSKMVHFGQMWATFGDVLEQIGKGAFGRQKGKAHLDNVAIEIFGGHTGDVVAKDIANAWNKVSDLIPDLLNSVGGSMKKLERYLPQKHSIARMVENGKASWVADHLNRTDWNKTRYGDGAAVPVSKREKFLQEVYDTKVSDGINKIDETQFRGAGIAGGNLLDKHRVLHYSDGRAWLDMHKKYGDGNVFDVMISHTAQMSHLIAVTQHFGPNPRATIANINAIMKKKANSISPKVLAKVQGEIDTKFNPMMEVVLRENPMNAESVQGSLIMATSNLLTAAQMGSAVLTAIPTDFIHGSIVNMVNHMDALPFSSIGTYLKTIAGDAEFQRSMMTQAGFVGDQQAAHTYHTSRMNAIATQGPAVTRRLADNVLRATLMNTHTTAKRWTTQSEFMGMMARYRDTNFNELPTNLMMKRYGITESDWNALRSEVKIFNPVKGVDFIRPIDILQSKLANKQEIFRKFQTMVLAESHTATPNSSIEASVALRGTTRPDTLHGALLHSFGMYKNFPLTYMNIVNQISLAHTNTPLGRWGTIAGIGAAMTVGGAMALQLKELREARTAMPMNTPAFWFKSMLAGGALSIWGDVLTQGVNTQGRDAADVLAGPIAGFVGDTSQLLLGDIAPFTNYLGGLDGGKDFHAKFPAKMVEYAKRYSPGSNVWWAKVALEREVWDRFSAMADPNVYSKRSRAEAKARKDKGNRSFWKPGDAAPTFTEN